MNIVENLFGIDMSKKQCNPSVFFVNAPINVRALNVYVDPETLVRLKTSPTTPAAEPGNETKTGCSDGLNDRD